MYLHILYVLSMNGRCWCFPKFPSLNMRWEMLLSKISGLHPREIWFSLPFYRSPPSSPPHLYSSLPLPPPHSFISLLPDHPSFQCHHLLELLRKWNFLSDVSIFFSMTNNIQDSNSADEWEVKCGWEQIGWRRIREGDRDSRLPGGVFNFNGDTNDSGQREEEKEISINGKWRVDGGYNVF